MRTIREQLRGYVLDIVSRTVYNAEQGLVPTGSRQLYYMLNRKPHSYSAVLNVFWNRILGTLPLTQECVKQTKMGVKGIPTRLRPFANLRRLLTRLRKGILNSLVMRKVSALKEKQYGKN